MEMRKGLDIGKSEKFSAGYTAMFFRGFLFVCFCFTMPEKMTQVSVLLTERTDTPAIAQSFALLYHVTR